MSGVRVPSSPQIARRPASMSKVKSPQAKKELSLELDRRNVNSANSKANRKAIPRRKQIDRHKERHAVGQILAGVGSQPSQDDAIAAELDAKIARDVARTKRFHKSPDAPLGTIVERKLSERRARQEQA